MSLPLLALDVQLLRSEDYAEEKNDRMMEQLWQEGWFVQYRRALDRYREGKGPQPVYPTDCVEEVELWVDEQMRLKYPGYRR